MTNKSIQVLALVTGLVIALAAFTLKDNSPSPVESGVNQRLYPALLDTINDATQLSLESADGKVTMTRDGDSWGLEQKHNYPVDLEMVSSCLRGLALMETVEKKTKNPERFSALGLEGLSEGSTSTVISLKDNQQREVVNLIVGSKRAGRTSGEEFYVRKADENQTWLVTAGLKTNADSTAWIDKQIAKVERARIQAVRVEHASGETLRISKPDADATTFTVHDIPEGRELSYVAVADGMATTLEWLNLEDVVPSDELELSDDWATKTTFWTFEGMRIEVTVIQKEEQSWAVFQARFDEKKAPFLEDSETALEASADLTAEIAALQARFSNWTYKLPVHSVTALGKLMSQLLKPLPIEPEETPELAPEEKVDIQDLLSPEQLEQLNQEHGLEIPVKDGE